MATIKIDGIDMEVEDGSTIIQAAEKAGVEIPRLCYHKDLSLSGTCRLCLVEVAGLPKLQAACSTPVRDGMEITTNSEQVAKARCAMLEFLLINHPLDCPVCDQAGECKLQDYVFQYGPVESRYQGEKRTFPYQDLGDRLVRNMNRCIHCLRCIRFAREVAGEEDFGSFYRGGKKVVGTYVESPVENNYSVNMVELCPVGALTSKSFRFKARVWNMTPVASVCIGCGTGCNIHLWAEDNQIQRITPRENSHVNGLWMCDEGRSTHNLAEGRTRIKSPMIREEGKLIPVDWLQALDKTVQTLKNIIGKDGPGAIGGLGSMRTTNEAAYLFKKLITSVIGSPHLDLWNRNRGEGCEETADGILLRNDGAPNYRGALDMGLTPGEEGMTAGEMFEAAGQGKLKALLIMGADPLQSYADGDRKIARALENLELLVVMDPLLSETAEKATVVFPTLFPFEGKGTFTNYQGRVQRVERAVKGTEGCRGDWEVLNLLCNKMGIRTPYSGPQDVMEEIAREIPRYGGVTYDALGEAGIKL